MELIIVFIIILFIILSIANANRSPHYRKSSGHHSYSSSGDFSSGDSDSS
ncbi:hypothetical protein [Paenibacillus sp. PL91]|nr:hypothetical protein [Paenibacillus sp. PL91]MBC9203014.1 hypothetical protein [Paenibacillus sp. PL91]